MEQNPLKSKEFKAVKWYAEVQKLMIAVAIITSFKKYISMLNEKMTNRLKQSKLHAGVRELDSKNTITDNLNIVRDRLKKFNKNMSARTYNDEIMNMLKLIWTRTDLNSIQLSELQNTLTSTLK